MDFVIESKEKIAVIGSGQFGTALASCAARNGHDVVLYARNEQVVESINEHHRNPRYLCDFELANNIRATSSVEEAISGAALLILCLPAQTIPDWLESMRHLIGSDTVICNTAKGLYLKDSTLLSSACSKALGEDKCSVQPYTVLSGPSFAKEIMHNQPTAVVVASKQHEHAVAVQKLLTTALFRCYTSHDIVGVELGGALKNPLAIGAGVIEGLGMGINTMAAYVTRSSTELQMLCQAMGGLPETISGLSGVGDLMLTAFGDLSRNRALGKRLSRGDALEDIIAGVTVEGVPTAAVAVKLAEAHGLDLPIFRAVAAILDSSMSVEEAQQFLLGRPVKLEMPKLWKKPDDAGSKAEPSPSTA